jgi:hypothetical protein
MMESLRLAVIPTFAQRAKLDSKMRYPCCTCTHTHKEASAACCHSLLRQIAGQSLTVYSRAGGLKQLDS